MRIKKKVFEDLVADAIDSLPEDFLELLENVAVVVEAWPTKEQLRSLDMEDDLLLGLYEGVALTDREGAYSGELPDKITIFQGALEEVCKTRAEIKDEVRRTVIHEVAHHFGIDEDRLRELGLD